MMVCSCLALTAALAVAVSARGCANPVEGTVHVDPNVAAKLGKHPGVPFADYAKNKIEPIGAKSRPRKASAPK
jgi:hypothetical protein